MDGELSGRVIACAIEVHRHLGPGLLESAYQKCLARELELQNIRFRNEVALPVAYKGISVETGYRLDFIIEELLIVEVKSIEALHPIQEAQLLTCLRISGLRLGLLINFNVPLLRNGIKRLAL